MFDVNFGSGYAGLGIVVTGLCRRSIILKRAVDFGSALETTNGHEFTRILRTAKMA